MHVFTSDLDEAGTDANVYLTLLAKNGGSAGPYKLLSSKDDFERGEEDLFFVDMANLQDVTAIEACGYSFGVDTFNRYSLAGVLRQSLIIRPIASSNLQDVAAIEVRGPLVAHICCLRTLSGLLQPARCHNT